MGARGRHDPLRGGHLRIRPGRPTGSVMSGLVLHTDRTEGTRTAAAALADVLRAGDLLVLDGPLGAGKTSFTQGLGQGLQVRGPVASPTFVIARVHPSLRGGPALVHVDAYRLRHTADKIGRASCRDSRCAAGR